MSPRRIVAFALVLGGCGPELPRVPPPRPFEAPPPVPAAPPATTAPRVREGTYRLPSHPPGISEDELALLSSVCSVAYRTVDGKTRVGCRSHPPFSGKGLPDGLLVPHEGDVQALCTVAAVHRGSFTAPGKKQAFLAFDECFDGPNGYEANAATSVSALLVEDTGSGFRSVAYEAGLSAATCDKGTTRDGRDVLFCRASFGAVGVGSVAYAYVVDFARAERPVYGRLLLWSDLLDCAAYEREGFRLRSGYTTAAIVGITTADLDHDGLPDARIEVERGHVAPSPKLDTTVRAACAGADPTLAPPLARTKLDLLSRGGVYTLSPESKKKVDTFRREEPESLGGLDGIAPAP